MRLGAPMSINVVLSKQLHGWIIEKTAIKLCQALQDQKIDVSLQATPSALADVNHFMLYHSHLVDPVLGTLNTMAVTHVDDAIKVQMIRKLLADGVRAAICMSSMTVEELVREGVDRNSLTYALPAHDGGIHPGRLVIGITSANYSDGRKRDWLLKRLAEEMSLADFEFQIFGSGWDEIASRLKSAGAAVYVKSPTEDYSADYSAIKAALPGFDYYFYPGLDEGSLGTLDALSAGIKTIVTTQGFHLDIPYGITHGFWDYDELRDIFESIKQERRRRIESVQQLTWSRFALRHLEIWSSLLGDNKVPPDDRLSNCCLEQTQGPQDNHHRYHILSYKELLKSRWGRHWVFSFWFPKMWRRYCAAHKMVRGFAVRVLKHSPI
jgi:hypothetical protein